MRLCRATIVILVLAIMPRPTEAAERTLLLAVQVNGHSTGKIGEFTLCDGALMARRGELHDLSFRVPDSLASVPDGPIALSDLPGLTWRIDQTSQTLYVTAANDRPLPALLHPEGNSGGGGAVTSGTGAMLNYDISGTGTDRRNVASGLLDLRAFSRWGASARDCWPMPAEVRAAPVRRRRYAWIRPIRCWTPIRCSAIAWATSSRVASAGRT